MADTVLFQVTTAISTSTIQLEDAIASVTYEGNDALLYKKYANTDQHFTDLLAAAMRLAVAGRQVNARNLPKKNRETFMVVIKSAIKEDQERRHLLDLGIAAAAAQEKT